MENIIRSSEMRYETIDEVGVWQLSCKQLLRATYLFEPEQGAMMSGFGVASDKHQTRIDGARLRHPNLNAKRKMRAGQQQHLLKVPEEGRRERCEICAHASLRDA